MRINRLNKVRNYRIFRDFSWPSSLPDFSRFNLIYGWNGSGKTSLSDLFGHIQQRQPLADAQVEVLIDKISVAGADFGTATLPAVRVFNRNTVDRSVFEVADQQLPPVFFLGEDSVEKQRQLEILKQQHKIKLQEQLRCKNKIDAAASLFNIFCAKEAKAIKNLLTVAGGGPFNNYNASHFKDKARALEQASLSPTVLSDTQRDEYLAIKNSKVMEKVVVPNFIFPDFLCLAKRVQTVLGRSIISSVINELTDHPSVAAWVNTGLSLHTGQAAASKCKFCDQPLPEQRIRQLEAHFNDEFKQFQKEIAHLIVDIESTQKGMQQALRAPAKEALYENLHVNYEKALQSLEQWIAIARLALDIVLSALKAKRDEPFKNFELTSCITHSGLAGEIGWHAEIFCQVTMVEFSHVQIAMGETAFVQLKSILEKHNLHTEHFDMAVKAARATLAQNEVLKVQPEWRKKYKSLERAHEDAVKVSAEVKKIASEIAELEIQIKQHRRPAEELNQEIAAYLGRAELRFEVEQNGYRITRSGYPATHLSDGERTAIAFLYFLKSLQGTDFDLKTGVVVIDDPVSSLDANLLFNAFGFLKQRTARAGQLFVLTHNFAFFKQVRNWYCSLPGQKKTNANSHLARFYMLTSESVNEKRGASLQALDPLLYQYQSEYHYLFKKVYEEAHKPVEQGLEGYYPMPNMARRLLESFLAFRVPDKPGELFQKLQCISFDESKKIRIIRFLHTYSHCDQIMEPEHDLAALSETPAILRELLDLIRTCDAAHFEGMSQLVALSAAQDALAAA